MSGKKEYVVTRTNTAGLKAEGKKGTVPDLEVGSIVTLTELQARARVNKVRPRDEAVESKAGRKSKAEEENKALIQRVAELESQNKALHNENAELKAAK